MNKKEYKKIVEKNIQKESPSKNILIAFFSGGVAGLFAELITN